MGDLKKPGDAMTELAARRRTYTVDEAADLLGMGRSTLYRLIKKQRVPHRVLPTGVTKFTDADIEKILADGYRPAAA